MRNSLNYWEVGQIRARRLWEVAVLPNPTNSIRSYTNGLRKRINERVVTNYNIQTNTRKVSSQQVINFTASNGSLRRWKTRFSLGLRQGTNDVQKVPGNYKDKIMSFHEAIMPLRHRWNYTHYNIANMDQTMVRFNSVLNYTNEKICAKTKNSSYRWK